MKHVYLFNEGNKDMRDLLGGKGANLSEMTNMDLPVPYGFVVTTETCLEYYKNGKDIDSNTIEEIKRAITRLEEKTNKKFGSVTNPLLLSVRSGAPVSMPGMMDTILNLGLNDEIAKNLAKDENSARFIYDSYRRLIMMFADVVKGKDKENFEKIIKNKKEKNNIDTDLELKAIDMYEIAVESKIIYKEIVGEEFEQDPYKQLIETIKAVFRSWNNERAIYYRKLNNISDNLGTAVNVQEMVYGNLSENSLTGVAFSRNPSTGENKLYGEYLNKAQGEDIVAGVRTPKQIDQLEKEYNNIYKELKDISKLLERHYKDMQDMEFTVENGKLYILQTRNGKRTMKASLKIANDLYEEGLISKEEAVLSIDADKINEVMHNTFNEESIKNGKLLTTGLPASPGAATGKIYFSVKDVLDKNEKTILIRKETSPEDIEGMHKAEGIVTVLGGMTSHAAVVARGMGKCCISGASDIIIDESKKQLICNGFTLNEGAEISIDGTSGNIYLGTLELEEAKINEDLNTILKWCQEIKEIEVKANAETLEDIKKAINLGASGIGLCRTEHMFFKKDRIVHLRKMILGNEIQRKEALKELLKIQAYDFKEIFKIINGKKITIRYIDPPLHEFLPKQKEEIVMLAQELNTTYDELLVKIDELKEVNPMMGLRGSRLGIVYPDIITMQTVAIIKSALEVKKEGYEVNPELMLPLISDINELKFLKEIITFTIDRISKEEKINYKIGTMIETPRSVVISKKIAKEVDFFSFGTNDLTQMTYGFSRDDAAKFLNNYLDKGIFTKDPFKTIDKEGVGNLIYTAKNLGKKANPNLECGVCGEHAGDPESISFFASIGLDYISCSPYRVPSAIIKAAKIKLDLQ